MSKDYIRLDYDFIIIFITLENIILIQHLNFIRIIFQLGVNLSDLSIRSEYLILLLIIIKK